MMTLRTAFREGVAFLEAKGVQDAYYEARCLLNAVGIDSTCLYSYPERLLTDAELAVLEHTLAERARGRPSAYIARKRDFYGLEFYVDERVLIPRPETELVVEKALEYSSARGGGLTIADIGTGSGVIAVTLAVNLPSATVFAVDISKSALEVAELNAVRFGVADRIKFLHGDLVGPLVEPVD
ncbi:MAG: peptide chain release factor N(5)-glutamine methyltransferase, partial [Dehalococcoidia bacterium]|nr:peptide chain release factor N(5)-glutamine methyltransferase [Dehalococcoidia bacterium]